ncbi:hypothetical protein KAH81_03035 [bacterium]|nr:hypothetical protein [bacterium]
METDNSILSYYGPAFNRPFVSILNSRQTKMPVGNDLWVSKTLEAVRFNIRENRTILSSIGMHTWNLLTWAIGHYGGKQILILPLYADDLEQEIVYDIVSEYSLDERRVAFAFYKTNCPITHPKMTWVERDRRVIKLADEISPISIRRGGNLDCEIKKSARGWCKINSASSIPYIKSKRRNIHKMLQKRNLDFILPDIWPKLTHWTHSFTEPWPGESKADYYRAIACSNEEYPRSALNSLLRILSDEVIYGTRRNFRNHMPNVSFTALNPKESLSLMNWNPSRSRFSFEFYGIAIDMDVAREKGIRKIIYGQEKAYDLLSPENRQYFQPIGSKVDWSKEKEWRFIGDFSLSDIPKDKIIVVVPNRVEAEIIEKRFNLRTYTPFSTS